MKTFLFDGKCKSYHVYKTKKEAMNRARELGKKVIGVFPGLPLRCGSCGEISYEEPRKRLTKCKCGSFELNIIFGI